MNVRFSSHRARVAVLAGLAVALAPLTGAHASTSSITTVGLSSPTHFDPANVLHDGPTRLPTAGKSSTTTPSAPVDIRSLSTSSSLTTTEAAKGEKLLAGYQESPSGGVTTGFISVQVPELACASREAQATAVGLGNEDTIGAPAFLGDVYAACLGIGQPGYMLEAQVCDIHKTTDGNVQPGDTVSVSLEVSGATVTVTTTDEDTGAVVTATGSVADCGHAVDRGGKAVVKHYVMGLFPVFDPTTRKLKETPQGNCPRGPSYLPFRICLQKNPSSPTGIDAGAPLKRLISKSSWGKVTPTEIKDDAFELVLDPKLKSCGIAHNNGDTGFSVVSQNFEPALDPYDSTAADDFRVKKDCAIDAVYVGGHFVGGAGPVDSETVTFYSDAGGAPGVVISRQTVVGIDEGAGAFDIPVGLWPAAGETYWMSVQANMSSASGEWGWENVSEQLGSPAVWQNPLDGFGTGCTTWTDVQSCTSATGPDMQFEIH